MMKIGIYRCLREVNTILIHDEDDPMQKLLRSSIDAETNAKHEFQFLDDNFGGGEALQLYARRQEDVCPDDFNGHVIFIEVPRSRYTVINPFNVAQEVLRRIRNTIVVLMIHDRFAETGGTGVNLMYPKAPAQLKQRCEDARIDYLSYGNDTERDEVLAVEFPILVQRVIKNRE